MYIMMETSKVDYAGRTVNENGDEIVFEGIRDPTKLTCLLVLVFSLMIILSFGLLLLFIPCIIVFFLLRCIQKVASVHHSQRTSLWRWV